MNRIQTYLKYALPVIFSLYVGFLIAFTHVHVVNGVTIVHSHPYHHNKGVPAEHEHSYAEFQLINLLSVIQISSAAFALILLTALFTSIHTFNHSPVYPVFIRPVTGQPSLRAPPAL